MNLWTLYVNCRKKTESTLLKERRTLTESGVERLIKNFILHWQNQSRLCLDIFNWHQQPLNQSWDPVLHTCYDTNNVMCTNFPSNATSNAMSTDDTISYPQMKNPKKRHKHTWYPIWAHPWPPPPNDKYLLMHNAILSIHSNHPVTNNYHSVRTDYNSTISCCYLV